MEAVNLPLDQWCAERPVRRVDADELEVLLPEQAAVRLRLESRPGAIDLCVDWPAPRWPPRSDSQVVPSLDELLQAAVAGRSALLTGRVDDENVQLRLPVYLDGLGRHTFLEAAAEVARAHHAVATAVQALEEARHDAAAVSAAPAASVPPAAPMLRVDASTDLVANDRSVVGRLEAGRWYAHGTEADGWLAVQDDEGVWGWVPAAAVVERRG